MLAPGVSYLVRVYSGNLDAKHTLRPTNEIEGWQEYNRQARGGCAQFIDGACVYQSGLKPEEAETIGLEIMRELLEGAHDQQPIDRLQMHAELIGVFSGLRDKPRPMWMPGDRGRWGFQHVRGGTRYFTRD